MAFYSLDLEATNGQYIYIADNASVSITGDLSFEAWVKLEQLPSTAGAEMALCCKGNAPNSNESWQIIITQSNKLRVIFSQDGTSGDRTHWESTNAVFVSGDVGSWVHIAVTVDVSVPTIVIYKNVSSVGVTVTTSDATAIYDSGANLEFGRLEATSGFYMDGKLDELRLWNDIRTSTEISNNYTKELVGTEANLQGYWKLNNDYTDETSNNNDLTPSGLPVFSTDTPSSLTSTSTSSSTSTTTTSTSTTTTSTSTTQTETSTTTTSTSTTTTSTSTTTTSTSTTTTSTSITTTSTTTTLDLRFIVEKIK